MAIEPCSAMILEIAPLFCCSPLRSSDHPGSLSTPAAARAPAATDAEGAGLAELTSGAAPRIVDPVPSRVRADPRRGHSAWLVQAAVVDADGAAIKGRPTRSAQTDAARALRLRSDSSARSVPVVEMYEYARMRSVVVRYEPSRPSPRRRPSKSPTPHQAPRASPAKGSTLSVPRSGQVTC